MRLDAAGNAAEALANPARHARARRAEVVRLVGLRSIGERAEELGGRTEMTCPPAGGTRVRAWLPMSVPVLEEVR